jgi:OmpA-OmpF porin, OOP family
MTRKGFRLMAVVVGFSPVFAHADEDVSGSQDYPTIKRYPGSRIWEYDQKDFDDYEVPLGPAQGDKFAKSQTVQGKLTMISYTNPTRRSVLEIYKNYEDGLKRGGFQVLFTCNDEKCGGGGPAGPKFAGFTPGYGLRFLSAKRSSSQGDTYVTVQVQGKNGEDSDSWLRVVEVKPMESGLVTVDAKALGDEIARVGHASVYGIYFDTNKAVVKPESEPALKEVVKLLTANPKLKLYVVGHTDGVGGLDSNLDLSRRRAQAVAQWLSGKGVAASRLKPEGVGPLAPVASNRAEDGRAKNRRVELVEQ